MRSTRIQEVISEIELRDVLCEAHIGTVFTCPQQQREPSNSSTEHHLGPESSHDTTLSHLTGSSKTSYLNNRLRLLLGRTRATLSFTKLLITSS